MGVCAFDRNVKKLSCENIARADTAADHGSPCAEGSGIRTLCAAQTEFHNAVSTGCEADPGSLCRDQALMIDDI